MPWPRVSAAARRASALLRAAGRPAVRTAALPAEALAALAEREGGFTYDPRSGARPASGFAFSAAPGSELRLPRLTPEALGEYARAHAAELAEPTAHLGAWRSPEGEWYLDVSRVLPDREAALRAARDARQRAVYDIGSGETIMLPEASH